jgi:hypothetical protein
MKLQLNSAEVPPQLDIHELAQRCSPARCFCDVVCMVTTQNYYLTAILALVLSGVSLAVGLANLVISQRNRLVDASEKKDSRAAEQAYKYSKEVQVRSKCCTSCARHNRLLS